MSPSSIRISRISRFSLRQILAIVLIFVMTALLAPTASAEAAIHATNSTVRATSGRVWTWLVATFSALGNAAHAQENRERQGVRPSPAQSKVEREGRVAAIELNVTGELVLTSRQRWQFAKPAEPGLAASPTC